MYVVVTILFTGLVIECHCYLFLQLIAYQYARCINVCVREKVSNICRLCCTRVWVGYMSFFSFKPPIHNPFYDVTITGSNKM